MKRIYTQTGDDGSTDVFLGGRVSKGGELVDAYGDVDEAVAALGVARSMCTEPLLAELLLALQRDLFVAAADLAANPDKRERLTGGVSLVTADMVARLEEHIDRLVAERPLRPVFIVPGATPTGAAIDHARTVVRRAERQVVRAQDHGQTVNPEVVRYLNRLSDLAFVLARHAAGEAEEPASRQ
ncbi:MAG TPA: cob(I)yrinic acid a,c-diamide adenosyltransferase [Cellulomonas sp.]|nr:cob(I)yrinic acid a,c-diamide adenosyltransferase [Cellulomonas sp.]